MAAVDKRFVVALGPVKAEILDLSAVADTESFKTQLQNPLFGFGVNVKDLDATTVAMNLSFSGRTVTVNQAGLTAADVVVIIFGF